MADKIGQEDKLSRRELPGLKQIPWIVTMDDGSTHSVWATTSSIARERARIATGKNPVSAAFDKDS